MSKMEQSLLSDRNGLQLGSRRRDSNLEQALSRQTSWQNININMQQCLDTVTAATPAASVALKGTGGGGAFDNTERNEWNDLIKPFVSDLAFRSLGRRLTESKITFQPYTCEAAILFVDLSGYSKINAALSSKGAHALSSAVNEYFDRLILIIGRYGGDIVKFAGDLVFVVWEGKAGDDVDLEYNLLCACRCALDLQEDAGSHPVKGTDLEFRIHCGLTMGVLESHVFAAPSHSHMQRLYHTISGNCLSQISDLVDLAEAGEIAIGQEVADFLGDMAVIDLDDDIVGAHLLRGLEPPSKATWETVEQHIEDSVMERQSFRIAGMEEEFIHPKVLSFLKHGGNEPTQIAQMRNLVTLFIGRTSGGNSVNWLMEVQSILDKFRCPIVQLINDDKGVHVIAAVNLYESVPDSSLLALNACRELVDKHVGVAIGVSMGPTFCGVTGSRTACRWDITGAPPVRAARLMEFALAENYEVVIDSSLLREPIAATRMSLLRESIRVKGTEEPVTVYRLSGSSLFSIFRVLDNSVVKSFNNKTVQKVRKSINTAIARTAVMVTGGPGSGQTLVCQQAASLSNLGSFSHVCDETSGMAQLAKSIAIWFSFAKFGHVQRQARIVTGHMENGRWSRAHDECVNLLDMAVNSGLRVCFVLRRIQFLDSFSLSIIHECLKGRTFVIGAQGRSIYRRRSNDVVFDGTNNSVTTSEGVRTTDNRCRRRRRARDARMCGGSGGKIVFLGCHTILYQHRSAQQIVDEIMRSSSAFQVKIVEMCESSQEQRKKVVREVCDVDVSDRWVRLHFETKGLRISSLIERAADSIKKASCDKERMEIHQFVSEKLVLDVDDEHEKSSRSNQGGVMKLTQAFDDLPPVMQVFLKVVAIASCRTLFKVPKTVALGVTNDLIGKMEIDSSRSDAIMKELELMYLLKSNLDGGFEMIEFPVPALADIIMDGCTPVQIKTISSALLYRLESMHYVNFKIPFMIAELFCVVANSGGVKPYSAVLNGYWKEGWDHFQVEKQNLNNAEKDLWLERISEMIRNAGGDVDSVIGGTHRKQSKVPKKVPSLLLQLKSYVGPVSCGPLSHTISVISRNIFQAYGALARKDDGLLHELSFHTHNATERYKEEMNALEKFLENEGFPMAETKQSQNSLFREECEEIDALSELPTTAQGVVSMSTRFLYDFVPKYIVPRTERLRLAALAALGNKPNFLVSITSETISAAFEELQAIHETCWKDLTENALMILATRNWKPAEVPEYLPPSHYHTICNLRDTVLRPKVRSLPFQHDANFSDMAAFLIATAVLDGVRGDEDESSESDSHADSDSDSDSFDSDEEDLVAELISNGGNANLISSALKSTSQPGADHGGGGLACSRPMQMQEESPTPNNFGNTSMSLNHVMVALSAAAQRTATMERRISTDGVPENEPNS